MKDRGHVTGNATSPPPLLQLREGGGDCRRPLIREHLQEVVAEVTD